MAFNASAYIKDNYMPWLVDVVYNSNVLLHHFYKRKGIKYISGNTHHWNFLFAKLTGGGAYSKGAAATFPEPNTTVQGTLYMKSYWQPIKVEGIDLRQNQGSAAIGSWLQNQMMNAKATFMDFLGDDLYGTYTGNSSSEHIMGLPVYVDSGTLYGTIFDLSRTTYPYLAAQEIDNSNAEITEATLQRALILPVATKATPDMMVMTKSSFIKTINAISPKNKLEIYDSVIGGGFTGIVWAGIPIIRDDKCPAKTIFGLNTELMDLYSLEADRGNSGFLVKPFVDDQTKIDSIVAKIICDLMFVGESPRANFKIKNVNETF